MQKLTVLQLRDIDEKLRNNFKAACAKKGKTMKEVVAQLMLDFVEAAENRADNS